MLRFGVSAALLLVIWDFDFKLFGLTTGRLLALSRDHSLVPDYQTLSLNPKP